MAVQTFSGAFPVQPGSSASPNLTDLWTSLVPSSGPPVGWTPGNMVVEALALTPPFTQRWQLLAVAVQANLQLIESFTGEINYGKLGQILAGLVPNGVSQTQPPVAIGQLNGLQIPSNQVGVGTLWDPAADPLPPVTKVLGQGPTLPMSCSVQLPQPIDLPQAEQGGIGMWMKPSLLGSSGGASASTVGLLIANANYTVTYDDGVTPPNYA